MGHTFTVGAKIEIEAADLAALLDVHEFNASRIGTRGVSPEVHERLASALVVENKGEFKCQFSTDGMDNSDAANVLYEIDMEIRRSVIGSSIKNPQGETIGEWRLS